MQIELLQTDITTLEVDAVVNAANSSLMGGGGVDGAIHRAGGKVILDECMAIRQRQGGCKPGEAVITTGGNLPARHVIHTVGPVWEGGANREDATLESCYRNALALAGQHDLKVLAFPNISTGVYRFPKERAAAIALRAIRDHAADAGVERVIFACHDPENYRIYGELM